MKKIKENEFSNDIKLERKKLREQLKTVQTELVSNFTELHKYDPCADYKKYLELTQKCHVLIEEHDKIVTELL